jgi:hypothetical protein
LAKPKPWDVTRLVEAKHAGCFTDIDPDVYRLRTRNLLRSYAADCHDPAMQAAALELPADLDRRFGLG